MNKIKFNAALDMPFDDAVLIVRSALADQGFGVITEINVTETLKKKLNVDDFKEYIILGACNPKMAHRALAANDDVGLLLPCNVAIYREGDFVAVSAIVPSHMLGIIGDKEVCAVAEDVDKLMASVFDSLSK